MHNLRNLRCTASTKWGARQSDRYLKSWHIDHLLWNHGSSLTSVRGTLTDHFFSGERSGQSTWSAWSWWSASINDVYGGSLSGLVSEVSGRSVHEIVHGHAHVQTDQVDFCACTCAHMQETDLPISLNRGVETGPFEITRRCEWYFCTLNVIINLFSRNQTNSLCLRRRWSTNQKRHFLTDYSEGQ
jgi:hypothetical protein